jgi:hypothetical protein
MADVKAARKELARMQRSLRQWLDYRTRVDAAVAGTGPAKYGAASAQLARDQYRDPEVEAVLATQLDMLLRQVMPAGATLPTDAPALARLALTLPDAGSPQAQAGVGAFFTNPLLLGLLVGGLLLFQTISSWADVAKEREHYACIKAGACTDTGFWLKAGVVGAAALYAWHKTTWLDFLKSKGKPTTLVRARRR